MDLKLFTEQNGQTVPKKPGVRVEFTTISRPLDDGLYQGFASGSSRVFWILPCSQPSWARFHTNDCSSTVNRGSSVWGASQNLEELANHWFFGNDRSGFVSSNSLTGFG